MKLTARAALALALSCQLVAPQLLAQPAKEKSGEKAAAKKDKGGKKKKGKDDEKDAAEASTEAPAVAPLADSLTGMAKAEYEAGKVLFLDGDYAGAKLKFERVYELSNDARVLWNVAAAEKNLRHYSKTVTALKRYLAEGGDKLSEQDKSDAQQLVDAMSAFVASVTISVDQPGAEVKVDDDTVGTSPLPEAVLIDQGNHQLSVTKDGFKPYSQRQSITGGEQTSIDVKLTAIVHEGRLRVVAGVGDKISVDGKPVGKGTWEGKLPSGAHTLLVTGTGKRPYQTDVVVQDDQLTTSRIALEAEQKPAAAGGFMSTPWPWVIGGAVLAAGAGVGAYFIFKPEDEGPPPIQTGTLDPGSVQLGLGARRARWHF